MRVRALTVAWRVEDPRPLPKPVLARGQQGLWWWDVPDDLRGLVEEMEG